MAQKLWEKNVQVDQEVDTFTVGKDREMDDVMNCENLNMDDIIEEKSESFTQQPTYEEIEKPKVNVDVDSVVVEKKPIADDDFFDDFLGTEDE